MSELKVKFLKDWRGYEAGQERIVSETVARIWADKGVVKIGRQRKPKSVDEPTKDKVLRKPRSKKAVTA